MRSRRPLGQAFAGSTVEAESITLVMEMPNCVEPNAATRCGQSVYNLRMARISLWHDAAMLGIANFVLVLLALFIMLAPYLVLITVAFSGLLLHPVPFLHVGLNWLLTAVLAGWLHIMCFTPYVYPTCHDIADTFLRANASAKTRNWLRRIGIEPKKGQPD